MILVNWATTVDFECHRDDHGYDTIDDLANPTGVLIEKIEDLERIKQLIEAEIREMTDEAVQDIRWGENERNSFRGYDGKEVVVSMIWRKVAPLETL